MAAPVAIANDAKRTEMKASSPSIHFHAIVLIAPATSRFGMPAVAEGTLVVHGEADDVVPLSATLDWARSQSLPVTVVPGAGHFFHGQLTLLRRLLLLALAPPPL